MSGLPLREKSTAFVGAIATGESFTLRLADERLAHKDGGYVVLKKVKSIEVKFAVPAGTRLGRIRVIASVFLNPHPPLAAAESALYRFA